MAILLVPETIWLDGSIIEDAGSRLKKP